MSPRPPRKAVLLAAGLGTRMRPLSYDTPKPMMPLWGLPLIEHILRMLADWGVEDALINLHHEPSTLLDHVSRRRHTPPRITLSYEPLILGTGGPLRRTAWFLDANPFWLINTDVAADVPCRPFLDAFDARTSLAVLWVSPERGPRTVGIDPTGRVTTFHHPVPGTPGTVTFCGLHLLSPRILDFLPPEGPASIVTAYEAAMRAGSPIDTVAPSAAFWDDLGSRERYLGAHAEVRQRHAAHAPGARLYAPDHVWSPARLARHGVHVTGFAAVARDAVIEPGARLHNTVVWPGARILSAATATDAVIGSGVTLAIPAGGPVVRFAACPPTPATTWAIRHLPPPPAIPRARRAERAVRHAPELTPLPIVLPLAARGSDRSFTRLAAGGTSAILIAYGRARRENRRHVHHTGVLQRHGIPVPAVLADNPGLRCTLVQDLGTVSLEDRVAAVGIAACMPLYERLATVVARLHEIPLDALTRRTEPPFSPRLYRWEHDLFDAHFLKGRLHLSDARRATIRHELSGMARRLARHARVLVHRDLQSSNVLIRDGQPHLIDFQGMRPGAAAYDLASLLCDPYVMLPADRQDALRSRYHAARPHDTRCRDEFWIAAVQRLVQALGAFGRLSALPGTTRFSVHIPPALAMLDRALTRLPETAATFGLPPACPALHALVRHLLAEARDV